MKDADPDDTNDDSKQTDECLSCDGSGEKLHRGHGGDPVNDYVKPCADCKGTGRRT